jgi:hypothetical protein
MEKRFRDIPNFLGFLKRFGPDLIQNLTPQKNPDVPGW